MHLLRVTCHHKWPQLLNLNGGTATSVKRGERPRSGVPCGPKKKAPEKEWVGAADVWLWYTKAGSP